MIASMNNGFSDVDVISWKDLQSERTQANYKTQNALGRTTELGPEWSSVSSSGTTGIIVLLQQLLLQENGHVVLNCNLTSVFRTESIKCHVKLISTEKWTENNLKQQRVS